MQISGETLITKNGESFLQRELKPVAAGDAVAAPVMEILMSDHALDPLQLTIRCRFSISQHQLRIEDVEAFVLHRAHIEVTHSDDVVLVEVVFELINLLIPCHRTLQRLHGMSGVGLITLLHMQPQSHCATGCRRELISNFP